MEEKTQCWAIIDDEKHVASFWPGKPRKIEGTKNAWILGDQFMNVPYEMVQGIANDILGREMTEDDNPLDLTDYLNKER